jgi:hypothetical protein
MVKGKEEEKEKAQRLAEVATLGWRDIPSLMRGQYISQLLACPTGREDALRDLAGLLHLLGSKSRAQRPAEVAAFG